MLYSVVAPSYFLFLLKNGKRINRRKNLKREWKSESDFPIKRDKKGNKVLLDKINISMLPPMYMIIHIHQ